ncbi:MAG: Gfo/Idh/MocA family oxidoreductase, partial [Paracoccus sp. (in: a-proteobacteria)]|nr:Gfo/Idh/MocA family oxidoreductase [Paracoccus sp. (in: a-proteobacteria)]
MPSNAPLFDPLAIGGINAANRIVMAPLTRSRSTPDELAQTDLHATYYSQRAGAGLIVSEATQISTEGQGYAWTPGIYSEAQIEGWKKVTDAVHAKGGKIVCQLWHVGAISHNVFHDGAAPVSASEWTPKGEAFVGDLLPDGPTVPHPQARALETDEIPRLLNDYRHASECARRAGFDGVEVHDDPLALIADEGVDAVLLASPGFVHEEQLLACIELGKPVLCEKPLTMDSESSLRVIAAERAAGRPLIQVGFMRRFDSEYQALRDLVAEVRPHVVIPEIEAIATEVLLEVEAAGTVVVPTARAT